MNSYKLGKSYTFNTKKATILGATSNEVYLVGITNKRKRHVADANQKYWYEGHLARFVRAYSEKKVQTLSSKLVSYKDFEEILVLLSPDFSSLKRYCLFNIKYDY